MDDMKPCPFCGKPAERWIDNSGDSPTTEHGCRACMVSSWGWDATEWNTRPIEDALQAEVERLRYSLKILLHIIEEHPILRGHAHEISEIHKTLYPLSIDLDKGEWK